MENYPIYNNNKSYKINGNEFNKTCLEYKTIIQSHRRMQKETSYREVHPSEHFAESLGSAFLCRLPPHRWSDAAACPSLSHFQREKRDSHF